MSSRVVSLADFRRSGKDDVQPMTQSGVVVSSKGHRSVLTFARQQPITIEEVERLVPFRPAPDFTQRVDADSYNDWSDYVERLIVASWAYSTEQFHAFTMDQEAVVSEWNSNERRARAIDAVEVGLSAQIPVLQKAISASSFDVRMEASILASKLLEELQPQLVSIDAQILADSMQRNIPELLDLIEDPTDQVRLSLALNRSIGVLPEQKKGAALLAIVEIYQDFMAAFDPNSYEAQVIVGAYGNILNDVSDHRLREHVDLFRDGKAELSMIMRETDSRDMQQLADAVHEKLQGRLAALLG